MLPEWDDVPGMGKRLNDLFRQSWELINEAAQETDPDELFDIFEELKDIEQKIQHHRSVQTLQYAEPQF